MFDQTFHGTARPAARAVTVGSVAPENVPIQTHEPVGQLVENPLPFLGQLEPQLSCREKFKRLDVPQIIKKKRLDQPLSGSLPSFSSHTFQGS